MALVAKGISRQEAHEKIRVHSHAAGHVVKVDGKDNDLIERIKADPFFQPIIDQLPKLLEPRTFVGRAPEQVSAFLDGPVTKALEPYKAAMTNGHTAELHV